MLFKTLPLSEIKNRYVQPVDVFIAFSSFEERCLSVIQNLNLDIINTAYIIVNHDAPSQTHKNFQVMKQLLGETVTEVNVNLFEPLELTDQLISMVYKIIELNQKPRLLVDITTFTHEALLIFLAIVKRFLKNAEIEYIYNNAATYASETGTAAERWLSRGIRDVRSVLGYAGDIKPSQDTVLIMMLGYEYERAWRVIDSISPTELIITYNDSHGSTTQLNCEAGEKHATLLKELAAYYEKPEQYVLPSNNPFETAKMLMKIHNKIGKGKNVIIVPMNNKLATVGAAIVAYQKKEIQLCYAPAEIYNTSFYSVAGDSCYIFNLDDTQTE